MSFCPDAEVLKDKPDANLASGVVELECAGCEASNQVPRKHALRLVVSHTPQVREARRCRSIRAHSRI